jgi:DNA-binding CsgD family transcriptional regulator
MRAQGELTMLQIARTLGVGRSTLYQHLDLLDHRQVGDEVAFR